MQEIADWLRNLDLEQYAQQFADNDIDVSVLRHLTDADLEKIGVSLGHRRKILAAIAELSDTFHQKHEPIDGADPSLQKTAERRQVTVMFADLVGSTALSARLDPEDLRDVIASYHKCALETVRLFDGFVAQFLGDGVLAYFGYPHAHEDDAARAVRAGLRLTEAVTGLKTNAELQTRIGIASGVVVVGDLMGSGSALGRGIIGETPNLAARLQGIAEPNTVVIAEGTRRLVGNLFELQDIGAKELKGIAAPVRVWTALRASSVASRFEALHASGLGTFIGRERELEVLERGLDKARSQICVIDIVAEPGMGKSRLLHEFRQRIGEERAFVLSGSCSPDGQQTPFLPFTEVVRGSFHLSVGEAEKDIAQKLELGLTALGLYSSQNLGLLLHLLGLNAPSGALVGLDGVLIGLRTRDLFQQMLEARCRLSPVVMVIEDLQWIDTVSEEVLGKIVDKEPKLRLLVLLTRRPEYLPPWLDWTIVTKLHLEPLPFGDIRRLVQARLGVEVLPGPLVRQVVEKAEGNPLFAEEIVSFLTERGVLRTTAGQVEFDTNAVAAALPASVQSLLTARVDRLAAKDRTLLQAASVIGRRFDTELLAAVVEGIDDFEARLAAMQSLDLIRSEGKSNTYSFKHALVREALYHGLLTQSRAALHSRIANEIERRSGNRLIEVAETLAHHYSQTDDAKKAFTYLSMAGSRSLSVYSLEEAEGHLSAAIALVEKKPECASDQQIANALVDYTLLENALGKLRNVVETPDRFAERLRRLGDSIQIVLILHQKVFGLCFMTEFRGAVIEQANIIRMAERLGDDRSRAYAYASQILVSSAVAPMTVAQLERLVRSALDAASRTEDSYIRSVVRWVIAIDGISRGTIKVARDIAEEMSSIGRQLKDPRPVGMGMGILGWIALTSDDYEKALNCANECLRVAYTPQERINALGVRGAALALLKRHEAQAELSKVRRQLIELNWRYELLLTEPAFGVLAILSGKLAKGVRLIEAAIVAARHDGWRAAEDWTKLFLCEIYLEVLFPKEKARIGFVLKNIPILVKILFVGRTSIESIISQIKCNPQFDPNGHHIGRTEMILGLLYKGKKNYGLAARHLAEAKRIFSQFGQTPILTRVEAALAELVH
jgi:class 3 adenylate cyclase/tetratricopeptide (TPR) repeat protein